MPTTAEQLRAQDWGRIQSRLTAFAWTHTRRRSWDLAHELAQQAITDAYDHGGWDPEKGPLFNYLISRVTTLESTYRRRKRNSFELRMVDAPAYKNVAANDELADEVLDRKRIAEIFRKRLAERFANDEDVTAIMTLMMEDIVSPAAMVQASGLSLQRIRDARRRLFHYAERLSKELAIELDSEEDNEVTP